MSHVAKHHLVPFKAHARGDERMNAAVRSATRAAARSEKFACGAINIFVRARMLVDDFLQKGK